MARLVIQWWNEVLVGAVHCWLDCLLSTAVCCMNAVLYNTITSATALPQSHLSLPPQFIRKTTTQRPSCNSRCIHSSTTGDTHRHMSNIQNNHREFINLTSKQHNKLNNCVTILGWLKNWQIPGLKTRHFSVITVSRLTILCHINHAVKHWYWHYLVMAELTINDVLRAVHEAKSKASYKQLMVGGAKQGRCRGDIWCCGWRHFIGAMTRSWEQLLHLIESFKTWLQHTSTIYTATARTYTATIILNIILVHSNKLVHFNCLYITLKLSTLHPFFYSPNENIIN